MVMLMVMLVIVTMVMATCTPDNRTGWRPQKENTKVEICKNKLQ